MTLEHTLINNYVATVKILTITILWFDFLSCSRQTLTVWRLYLTIGQIMVMKLQNQCCLYLCKSTYNFCMTYWWLQIKHWQLWRTWQLLQGVSTPNSTTLSIRPWRYKIHFECKTTNKLTMIWLPELFEAKFDSCQVTLKRILRNQLCQNCPN